MKTKKITRIVVYLLLVLSIGAFLFPVYWMVISSFKNNSALISWPPSFSPVFSNLDNYITIFGNTKYLTYFKNSLITSGGAVVISLFVSVLAAYAFSRFRFRFKNLLMTSLMNIQVFPVTVIVISLFTFYTKLGLQSTYQGLILAELVYSLPFTVWFLKAFMDTVPFSLDEAARIDGCNSWQCFSRIILPLTLPGIASTSIYAFITSWNEYMFAFILTSRPEMKTLSVGIAEMNGFQQIRWNDMMAASLMASLPLILLFICLQKYFVSGLTSGAVKS